MKFERAYFVLSTLLYEIIQEQKSLFPIFPPRGGVLQSLISD